MRSNVDNQVRETDYFSDRYQTLEDTMRKYYTDNVCKKREFTE